LQEIETVKISLWSSSLEFSFFLLYETADGKDIEDFFKSFLVLTFPALKFITSKSVSMDRCCQSPAFSILLAGEAIAVCLAIVDFEDSSQLFSNLGFLQVQVTV